MDLLVDTSKKPCECSEKWIPAATSLLENNAKFNEVKVNPVTDWRNAMLDAMQKGRKRGYIVTHVGKEGTEGKSFLMKPLFAVFGAENVFISPTSRNFPLLHLEKARATLLDDWRFNEDILSYNLQLLWRTPI